MKYKSIYKTILGVSLSILSIQTITSQRGGNDDRNDHTIFRSIDGTNNNLEEGRIEWGASGTPFVRILEAEYGAEDPTGALNDTERLSPRAISNLICVEPETIFNERNLSAMNYTWGQFLDHDMTLTPTGDEYVPITLPENEPLFTLDIPFNRSNFVMIDGQREQINFNTSYIDGSQVYGSNEVRATWLRSFENGKLKTSVGDLLPYNTIDGEINSPIDTSAPEMDDTSENTVVSFVAGDVRASENPVLTAFHTVFLREHNRICDELIAEGLTDDEEIYQIARKNVGALIQSVTYNEYLPSLGVNISRYRGYDDNINASISNTFASAAFRFGHTQVSDDLILVDQNCEEDGPGEYDLVEGFFNSTLFLDHPVENWIKGATVHELYETNTQIDPVLRDFLFGDFDGVKFGLDLAAINIQRGRDQGAPSYNSLKEYYTGRPARRFSHISSVDSVATGLQNAYSEINRIDAWIGLLSEDLVEGSSFGETLKAILEEQFENLRNGDYYYFENDPFFSRNEENTIRNTTFTEIINRNSNATSLVDNVFYLDPCFPEEEEEEVAAKVLIDITDVALAEVYPNSFNDIINIDVTEDFQTGKIEIYSMNGSLLLSQELNGEKRTQLNTSSFSSGVYIAKLTVDLQLNILKLIK